MDQQEASVTLALALGSSIVLVELLRYAWALASCRREVREKSALSQIRDTYTRDVEGAKRALGAIHDEGARAWLAGGLLRLVFVAGAIVWAIGVAGNTSALLEAIAKTPLAFVPSFAALLAAIRGFPSAHKKEEPELRKG